MTRRHTAAAVTRTIVRALLAFAALALAHDGRADPAAACIDAAGGGARAACLAVAEASLADVGALRSLARRLEDADRFEDAAAVYRRGLDSHRGDRALRQGYMRARSEARARRLLVEHDADDPAPPARPPAKAAAAPAARSHPPPLLPSAAGGRYRALIIGNQNYAQFPRLESPLADARAVAALLEEAYGFEATTVLDASRYELFRALGDLRRTVTERDSVLVYYAGHGYLDEVTSRGYWLPVDAERDNQANWISTSDIADLLAGLSAHHALVVADSCFSGSLLRTTAGVDIEERGGLLRRLSERRSRTIMTSGGMEPVLDRGLRRHSVFAEALLRTLADNDGLLEAGRLFVRVRDHVAVNADQTPQYAPLRSAGHEGGDFIFSRIR